MSLFACVGGFAAGAVRVQGQSQTVALTPLQRLEFRRVSLGWVLNHFDTQWLRFVIHNFDGRSVATSPLSGNKESGHRRQLNRRNCAAREAQARLRQRRVIEED